MLNKWLENANKVLGVKSIRKHTDLGLRDSKEVIDVCLSLRNLQIIEANTVEDAELLTATLKDCQFEAMHVAE